MRYLDFKYNKLTQFPLTKVSDPKFTSVRPTQKITPVERNRQHHLDWGARPEGHGLQWAERSLCQVSSWTSKVQEQGSPLLSCVCMSLFTGHQLMNGQSRGAESSRHLFKCLAQLLLNTVADQTDNYITFLPWCALDKLLNFPVSVFSAVTQKKTW